MRRINNDRHDGDLEAFSLAKFLRPALDPKIWAFGLIFMYVVDTWWTDQRYPYSSHLPACLRCLTTVTLAILYFLPIILMQDMGFSVGASQCLVAPPYVLAGIIMHVSAWLGDKYRARGLILVANALLCIVGLPMMGFAKGNATRYTGVFLTVAGSNANVPALLAYQANNVRGQWTRAMSSATLVGLGGVGGIVSGLVFRNQDAPQYQPGMYAALA